MFLALNHPTPPDLRLLSDPFILYNFLVAELTAFLSSCGCYFQSFRAPYSYNFAPFVDPSCCTNHPATRLFFLLFLVDLLTLFVLLFEFLSTFYVIVVLLYCTLLCYLWAQPYFIF